MRLLVSTWKSIFVLDLTNNHVQHVHRGSGSYFGLTWDHNFVYAAARFGYNDVTEKATERILKFDKQLNFAGYLEGAEEENVGLHSIQYDPEHRKLWVTATAKNKIKIMHLERGFIRDLYPNPAVKDSDWNHFNAVTINGNYMMVNAHNTRNKIPHGEVYFCKRHNPHNVEFVAATKGSSQSHDCFILNGKLYTCASEEGQIKSFNGNTILPSRHAGYTRGVVLARKTLIVGESKRADRYSRKNVDGWIHIYRRVKRLRHLKTLHFPKVGQILAIRALDMPDAHHMIPPFLTSHHKINLPVDESLPIIQREK